MGNKPVFLSALVVLGIVAVAIFAPKIATHDPNRCDVRRILSPPGKGHLLGTDELGRDVFSRIVYGARVTLLVSAAALVVGLTTGVAIGIVAGYFGGTVDFLVMRFVDVLLSIPGILLAILIAVVLGSGLVPVIVAIGVFALPTYARVARGSVLALKEEEFVEAARALGAGPMRIILRHILPNLIGPILVLATMDMGTAALTTAGLSFLGVGISPPTPEWGLMVNTARPYIRQAPHAIVFPGMAIFITVLAFNILGDGLRDLLDVKI